MIRTFTIILVLTSICFSQQADKSKNESLIRGEAVIRKAQEAAGIFQSIASFQIKLHNFGNNKIQQVELPTDEQNEITVASANRISFLAVFKDGGLNRRIWNERSFRETTEYDSSDGQRRVVDTTNGIQFSQKVLNATKSKNSEAILPYSKEAIFSDNLWEFVFPLILSHPIENSAKFEYVGRAQAGDQIARIVQTTSGSGHILQFFFDEKTSHLLLMIEKFKGQDKEFERKLYFTNREKRGGILIPTQIKIEHKVIPTVGSPNVLLNYVDILDFIINPKIKPEIFKMN